MNKIPIILDCDPGLDDAYAIMLANSAKTLEVRGVTVVAGNVEFYNTARNAVDLASMLHMKTRVAKGAEAPLIINLQTAAHIHGGNGLGGYLLPKANIDFDLDKAWDVIHQEAVKCAGDLILVATGPLTNVAIALLKYPDLKRNIKKIVMMGGSTTTGNHSPYAEFNIWADPHAAEIVFKSGLPLIMFGLNVTHQCALSEAEMTELGEIDSEIQALIQGLNKHVFGEDQVRTRGGTLTLHDAVALAYLLDENIAKLRPAQVVCELNSPFSCGQTVVDFNCLPEEANVKVAVEANKQVFKGILTTMVKSYKIK